MFGISSHSVQSALKALQVFHYTRPKDTLSKLIGDNDHHQIFFWAIDYTQDPNYHNEYSLWYPREASLLKATSIFTYLCLDMIYGSPKISVRKIIFKSLPILVHNTPSELVEEVEKGISTKILK